MFFSIFFSLFFLALIKKCNKNPRTREPKNPRTQELENPRNQEPEKPRTQEPDTKILFIEYYKDLWLLWQLSFENFSIVAETKSSAIYYTIQLIQMCNANQYINRIVTSQQSTFQSTNFIQFIQMCNADFLKFQTNITSNSILQKGGDFQISPKNVSLRVFGFPQKR